MAGLTRFELATSCVTGRRSNQAELQPLKYMITGPAEKLLKLLWPRFSPNLALNPGNLCPYNGRYITIIVLPCQAIDTAARKGTVPFQGTGRRTLSPPFPTPTAQIPLQ